MQIVQAKCNAKNVKHLLIPQYVSHSIKSDLFNPILPYANAAINAILYENRYIKNNDMLLPPG